MVIVPVSFMMFFIAGANVRHLLLLIFMGIMMVVTVYSIGDYDKETGKNKNTFGYITQRIDTFLDDSEEAIQNKTINYQTEQALIAIGS